MQSKTKKVMAMPTSAKPNFSVEMIFAKETKGTFVYNSRDPEAAITSVYVRKTGLPTGAPKEIKLTVSED